MIGPMHFRCLTLAVLTVSCGALVLQAAEPATDKPKPPPPTAYTDPAKTDDDFVYQGEFAGENEGKKYGVRIIALGDGKFEAVGFEGGLPGEGWQGQWSDVTHTQGERAQGDSFVSFKTEKLKAKALGDSIDVLTLQDEKKFEMNRVRRISPTMDAKAPEGAIVLFDGKDKNGFPGSRISEDGLLMEGATSGEKYTDFTLHLEFRLPYIPKGRSQGRGNSGLYLQGRYEVQVLDSFGLEGKDNECGGIYKIAVPKVNMCLPPLVWQTYDVDFTAAKFDAEGKKTANAKVTVKHNGVLIHENQELPQTTASAPTSTEANTPGPIYLQNHGNPVRYRNIWLKPRA
ncbi:hypothetical protein BH11VER1_BH11VER1_41960 [soil metagenome]